MRVFTYERVEDVHVLDARLLGLCQLEGRIVVVVIIIAVAIVIVVIVVAVFEAKDVFLDVPDAGRAS